MYIIIVNPAAGNGKAKRVFNRIQKEPLYKQKNCRSFHTNRSGHAERLAEQISAIHYESIEAVMVIGGDGTLHEVLNGLAKYPELPIAMIPAGSGNDFARGIAFKLSGVELFKKVVTNPKRVVISPGTYLLNEKHEHQKRFFINSVGIGLDGKVVALANRPTYRKVMKRLHLHSLSYIVSLLWNVIKLEPEHLEVEIDHRKVVFPQAIMLTVPNHSYFGKGMRISPQADIHQPTFHTIFIEPLPKWKVMTLFMFVFIGQHTRLKKVHEIKGAYIRITARKSLHMQVDGEQEVCNQCIIQQADQERILYGG
ncbi:diacylglycerol/lipid kinase family protein [Halobacillus hunanensis]|uniref:diacylglycerol/lipid kinase family protein n=1 Tax=Halobacillus hunanensis TaxID=578214 RepID=UPI0009A69206|nr:YegS/Rv2252/BmrU family lipid kinase [Halobacillus hunanensis]